MNTVLLCDYALYVVRETARGEGLMAPSKLAPTPAQCRRAANLRLAIAEVRALLARLDAGDLAAQLGLEPVDASRGPAARWMDSLRSTEPPWQDELALGALDPSSGRERRWAEDVLLGHLHLDPRAPRAVAYAGMARAVSALREVMEHFGGAVQIEAAAGVWRLANDPAARVLLESARAGGEAELARRAERGLSAGSRVVRLSRSA